MRRTRRIEQTVKMLVLEGFGGLVGLFRVILAGTELLE